MIAARDSTSPFFGLARIRLEGGESGDGYIPDATIRQLIEGGRGGRAWRSDDGFEYVYVAPYTQRSGGLGQLDFGELARLLVRFLG